MKNLDYVGNAKIISINELPKVNDKHELINNLVCIEVKIFDFKENYIVYRVKYCDKDALHILDDFFCDCSSWTYAIKKSELQG